MGARRRRTLRRRMRRGTKTRTRRPPSELRTWHRFGGTGTVQFTSSAWNQEVNQVRLRSLLLFRGERAAVSAQAANRVHLTARGTKSSESLGGSKPPFSPIQSNSPRVPGTRR